MTLLLSGCSVTLDIGIPLPESQPNQSDTLSLLHYDNAVASASPSAVPLPDGILEVFYFDVGQADCTLIKSGDYAILVDAGNTGQDELILGYLDALGIKKLDILVPTHPHADHVGSMASVVQTYEIEMILMSYAYSDSDVYTEFLDAIEEADVPITVPEVGDTYALGDITVTVLAPVNDYNDLNDASLVIKISYGEVSFLFTGDAESLSETDQLNTGLDLSADVLKVGHHGSISSSTRAYLDAVKPDYAVIQVGMGNSYGHPVQEVLTRLEEMNAKIYRTDLDGTITFSSDGRTLTIEKSNVEPITPALSGESDNKINSTYIGNKNSKIFHRLTCGSLPAEKNRIYLVNRDDAVNQGFRACLKCNP